MKARKQNTKPITRVEHNFATYKQHYSHIFVPSSFLIRFGDFLGSVSC